MEKAEICKTFQVVGVCNFICNFSVKHCASLVKGPKLLFKTDKPLYVHNDFEYVWHTCASNDHISDFASLLETMPFHEALLIC
jgi:hypothetical protein